MEKSSVFHKPLFNSRNLYFDLLSGVTYNDIEATINVIETTLDILTSGSGVIDTDLSVSGDITAKGGDLFLIDTNEAISSNGSDLFFTVNGSETVRFQSGGNVGIGTDNPTQTLDINGDALVRGGDLFLTDTNESVSSNGTDMYFTVGGSEVMRLDPNGNIGIGTDNPIYELQILKANAGGDTRFQIKNDSTSANSDAIIQITSRASTGGNPILCMDIASVAGSEWYLGVDNGNNENYCISENLDLSSPHFIVENGTGNIGVGTDSPGQKLDINGDVLVRGGDLFLTDTNEKISSDGTDLTLHVNGSESVRFQSGGNVGIGITTPSETLDINGDTLIRGGNLYLTGVTNQISCDGTDFDIVVNETNKLNINGDDFNLYGESLPTLNIGASGATSNASINLRYNDPISDLRLFSSSSGDGIFSRNAADFSIYHLAGNPLLLQEFGGNVGVGTNNPGQKLDVNGDILVRGGDLYLSDTNEKISSNGTDLTLHVNGSETVRFQSGGNVGIGITNPSDKLHVFGNTLNDNTITLTEDITSDLISHYTFHEGSGTILFDNVSGNDATITGGTWSSVTETDDIKTHYYLDNASETTYNILPGTTVSNSTDLTVSMWLYHNSGYGVNDYILGMNGVAPFYGHLVTNGGNIQFFGGGSNKTICSEPSTNTWHQWTIVMSGVNITVYIDGVVCGTRSDFFDNNLYPLRYIGSAAGGGQPFVGRMTDVRIFERAFTADESSDLYQDYLATGTVKVMNGNIGIGTSNPASELDVRGNVRITNDNALALLVEKSDNTGVLAVDTIDGNVGIGITNPTQTLDVNGDVLVRGGDLYLSDTNESIRSNGTHMYFTVGGSEVVRFESSGNVGIGTADPESALHILGSRSNTPITKGIHMGEGGTGDYAIDLCAASSSNNCYIDFTYPGIDFRGRIIYSNNTDGMDFYTAGLKTMAIDSSGNIGIGTIPPTQKLDVNGDVLVRGGDLYLSDTNEKISSNGTDLTLHVNNAEVARFQSGGNVGIGTNNPLYPLDVNGNALIRGNLNMTNCTLTVDGSDLYFVVGGSEVVRFETGGNVGVGTNNPSSILDVSSTTSAFLPPRMTTTQRNAITGIDGMMIFNSTTNNIQAYYSGTWNNL